MGLFCRLGAFLSAYMAHVVLINRVDLRGWGNALSRREDGPLNDLHIHAIDILMHTPSPFRLDNPRTAASAF
jgi:hypothetical protein